MKKFWAFISNGTYSVGTTGQTVYLYNENGDEIGKFKDIIYAYKPMFSPDGKIFAVKSTDGRLAVYSLVTRSLIKKFRYSKFDAAQDAGFCFSHGGKYFVNLESHGKDGLQCAVTLYDTESFSIVSQLMLDNDVVLSHIEFDDNTDEYYVLGLNRGRHIVCFIAKYKNNAIVDKIEISEKEYDFYNSYFVLKMEGFTEKSYEWSYLENELNELKSANYSLSQLYKQYNVL